MTKADCFFLGKVTKPHALKGEVILWLDVDRPEDYSDLDAVFLDIKNELVPYIIDEIQIRGKKSIAKFEDINTIEQTESIIGADLYLPLNTLPKLKGTQFYYHEILGFNIYDTKTTQIIGIIKAVYESNAHDLFAVEKDEKEILIPIVDEFIVNIDREKKSISVNLPDGLVDIYMNS